MISRIVGIMGTKAPCMSRARRDSSYSVNTSSKKQKHDFGTLGEQDQGETGESRLLEQEDTL